MLNFRILISNVSYIKNCYTGIYQFFLKEKLDFDTDPLKSGPESEPCLYTIVYRLKTRHTMFSGGSRGFIFHTKFVFHAQLQT